MRRRLCAGILGLTLVSSGIAEAVVTPTLRIVPVAYDAGSVVVELRIETGEDRFRVFGIDLVVLDVGAGASLPFDAVDVDLEGTLSESWIAVDAVCPDGDCSRVRIGGFDATGVDAFTHGVLCRLELSGVPVGDGRLSVHAVDPQDDLQHAQVVVESETPDAVIGGTPTWGALKVLVR